MTKRLTEVLRIGRLLDTVHRFTARLEITTWIARKVRNQCNAVLKYRMGGIHHAAVNGEDLLLKCIAVDLRVFIDVGANVGDWTASLLKIAAENGAQPRGLLFEPGRAAFRLLKSSFSEVASIKLVNKAVSDSAGQVNFFEEDGAGETSSITPHANLKASSRHVVDCCRLDDLIESFGENRIDFLKIDVEGYDLHVLRGAGAWLDPQSVTLIQFEYNTAWAYAGSTLFAAKELLESKGYALLRLDGAGLHAHDYEEDREFFTYANFVAVAPARAAQLTAALAGQRKAPNGA